MNTPATNLEAFVPAARPVYGLGRPIEWLFGFGKPAYIPTQYLYFGEDHLLMVQRQNTSETYRRIYFADIQGVCVQQNNGHLVASACALLFALGLGVLAYLLQLSDNTIILNLIGVMLCACAGLFMLLFAILNVMRGALCTCTLLTAVEAVALPGIARMAHARRFARELSARVTAVQGPLPPLAEGEAGRLVAFQRPAPRLRRATVPVNLKWHLLFYSFVVMGWLLTGLQMAFIIQEATAFPVLVQLLSAIVLSGLALSGSMAVGCQRDMKLGKGLDLWVRVSLVCICALLVIYSMAKGFMMGMPDQSPSGIAPIELIVVDLALNTIFVVVGAIVLLQERVRMARQPLAG